MKKQQIKAGFASIILGLMSPLAVLVPSASAATVTWTGEGDGGFSSAVNWGGAIAITGDTIVFPASANYQMPNQDWTPQDFVKMIFNGEVTGPSSKSYTITGNGIGITSAIEAIMTGSGGDHAVEVDVTLGADATFLTTGANTLTVGDVGTTLDIGAHDLTLQADGGTITLAGEIDGSGKVVVDGNKKVNMLAKPATGYTGSAEVTSGEYVVTEETEGNIVINGGTLKGNSDLLGTVTMSSGAIAPGNSPGCLGTSDLTLTGGTYLVEVNGTDACTGYDQTAVVGAVSISGASFDIARLSSFAPADNTVFAIILNDGTDAVSGTFTNLPNGATFTEEGYTYQINYDAGDGNDVLVQVIGTPTAPDTGLDSVLTNPMITLLAIVATATVLGGLKFVEQRRK